MYSCICSILWLSFSRAESFDCGVANITCVLPHSFGQFVNLTSLAFFCYLKQIDFVLLCVLLVIE